VNTAVEGRPLVTAPRERGWRWLILALAGAMAVSLVAYWPPSLSLMAVLLRWLLPVESFGSILLAGIGACALAGWTRGGKLLPAVLAAGYLVWLVWRGPADTGAVGAFSRGWTLLITACFGWLCMMSSARPLFTRALSAIVLAGALTVLLSSWRDPLSGAALSRRGVSFDQALDQRRDESLSVWRDRVSSEAWTALARRVPGVSRSAEQTVAWVESSPPPTGVVPSLLVLESLAALALAWSLWHRLVRVRLGPPLAAFSEFVFNDQFVWGLVAGATLVLLPSLSAWRTLGVNLCIVFGALYALRGVAVLLWWLPDRFAVVPLLLLLVCIPLLGPVLVLATVAVLALGLGLGDTWRDFRRSARPLRPDARP